MEMKKKTKKKWYMAIGAVAAFVLLMIFAFSGESGVLLKGFFTGNISEEELRELLQSFGWRGYLGIMILSALQIVCTFLPAEPVQVLAGYTYGFPVGLTLCMIGVLVGNTLIYILQNIFGDRLRGFLVKKLDLDLEKIARSSKYVLIIFILYFLPVIPYGMICFFAASMGMSYYRYILITCLGALPSLCIGVGLGHIMIVIDGLAVVGLLAVLLLAVYLVLRKKEVLFSKLNSFAEQNKKAGTNKVRDMNGFVMTVAYFGIRVWLFLSGVRMKVVNKVGTPEKPSIILCNHGAFTDFVYAAALIRKYRPNIIVARLYFYNTYLGWLLRTIGAFPKSMFASDVESVRNSLTVLREKNHLAMMPEARLSTTGRFEDIQESTYSFIKKSGVSVYAIKLSGDYLAHPKWGKGLRRGALVEAEMDILFTAEQVKNLSVQEIKEGIEKHLDYNEFTWLAQHPEIHYRCRHLAEGLENILTVCPVCNRKHTIKTKGNKVFCEHCGYLTELDDRYGFTEGFPFRDLTGWYDWQKERMEKEIVENESYCLSSKVELRLPGNGSGLTRYGGHGECTLRRDGLTYTGTKDGEKVTLSFSLRQVYRLLFGAGENFEIYDGTEILYFVPEERRSAVDWYMASMILYDKTVLPEI